ncbi:MAG: hypothetical protein JJE32_03845 [Deltaproteobacteria bacterium]|nr:hypothetical protein [Deltaproteobacteria bacterium]
MTPNPFSRVHPKTLPPNASGATVSPEFPSSRFFFVAMVIGCVEPSLWFRLEMVKLLEKMRELAI